MKREKNRQVTAGHNHNNHLWMMAVCCGIPILGLLAIPMLGLSSSTLETVLLLVCPIGMGAMMVMMHRGEQSEKAGHNCCDRTADQSLPKAGEKQGTSNREPHPANRTDPASLEI